MKVTKSVMAFALMLALNACTTQVEKMSEDGTLEEVQANYQEYEEITSQFRVNDQWWLGYGDQQLNRLIDRALANNVNLAKAAIAVNRAYYNANLVGADLVPTFSGSGSSSVSKGLGSPSKNMVSTGTSSIGNQIGFNLSYTIDLWGRLKDSVSAAEWEAKATQEDLQATRLSIINGVISSYYNLAYYQDAIRITEQNIKNYEEINRIMNNKMKAGVVDRLPVEQSTQSILMAKNTLISLRTAQKATEQTLRNLVNAKPNDKLVSRYPSVMNVKLQGVNMNVPISVIANRPDIIAALQRFQGSFKSLRAMENSWFPSVTLGASLTSSAKSVRNVPNSPVLGGLISFNLPFLDWHRVENNIRISEESYKLAKLNYEQTVTTALNEIDNYYYAYQQSRTGYSNLQKQHASNKKISTYYKNRYDQGVSEFREWLNALNTERSSELSLLETKFNILRNENAVYQAMAGKYRR